MAASFPAPPDELIEVEHDFPEPPPDYELQHGSSQDLIPPHKLPNPVLDSKARMHINREIKFNAKFGIKPLDNKPELQKELERRKAAKEKKEILDEQKRNRTSLEHRLEQQLEKLAYKEREHQNLLEKEQKKSELERVHQKIQSKNAAMDASKLSVS